MISEETLTLYYYDDGLTASERREVQAALREDAELAARYQEIRRQLDDWREPYDLEAPAHLVQRWHDSIGQAARAERTTSPKQDSPFHFLSFAWGAAITAALAIGIGIGVYLSGGNSISPPDGGMQANTPRIQDAVIPASFTRGLQVYLQDSQDEITRLPVDAAAERALLLMQIIEQNRLFERTATQNNAPKVARVLRAFEPILLRLASEDLAPEDAEALRAQLAFELNVLLTKLARDTSDEEHSI